MDDKNKSKRNNWICGRTNEGDVCANGPDNTGLCCADFACKPSKDNNRWHCTRAKEQGGCCQSGPSPTGQCAIRVSECQPIYHPDAKHKRIIIWAFVVSFSLLLYILASPRLPKVLEPGKLTTAHSALSNCGECHHAYAKSPIHAGITLFTESIQTLNNQSCLACHQLGTHPNDAHSLPSAELATITQRIKAFNKKTMNRESYPDAPPSLLSMKTPQTNIACSLCHKEHHGLKNNLQMISSEKCQACHIKPFHQFSKDHPRFTNYPHTQRTRIIFDHSLHFSKHFPKKKNIKFAPKQCMDCHKLDKKSQHMVLKSYYKICASCHDKQIMGQQRVEDKGFAFFTIPGIDLQNLQKNKVDIGLWPGNAQGELTEFTKALLSNDKKFKNAYPNIAELDWLDLEKSNIKKLRDVSQVAWSIKKYLNTLATHGSDKAYLPLTEIKKKTSPRIISEHPELMSEDNVNALILSTFPNVNTEMKQYLTGNNTARTTPFAATKDKSDIAKKQISREVWAKQGGWYRDEFTLYYRPRHHADKFIVNWAGIAAKTNNKPLFQLLTETEAPGACGKCHSVESQAQHPLTIHWKMRQKPASKHTFIKFSHNMHLSLMGKDGCQTCHKLNNKADYLASFKSGSTKFESNFLAIAEKDCLSCHNKKKANEHCLVCHNYHIGTVKSLIRHSPTLK